MKPFVVVKPYRIKDYKLLISTVMRRSDDVDHDRRNAKKNDTANIIIVADIFTQRHLCRLFIPTVGTIETNDDTAPLSK